MVGLVAAVAFGNPIPKESTDPTYGKSKPKFPLAKSWELNLSSEDKNKLGSSDDDGITVINACSRRQSASPPGLEENYSKLLQKAKSSRLRWYEVTVINLGGLKDVCVYVPDTDDVQAPGETSKLDSRDYRV